MTPIEKINIRNGGALRTIASDKTHRARRMLHKQGHHHLCNHELGRIINDAKAERRNKRTAAQR